MKAAFVQLSAHCGLELTEDEVAFWNHFASYDLVESFQALSGKYTAEEITAYVHLMREATRRIIDSVGKSREHLFDDRHVGIKKKNPL